MSVRIVRTRNGEDVIADLYEVTTKEEPNKAIAFQLVHPYNVYVADDGSSSLLVEGEGEIQKTSSPELEFTPWAPLAKDRKIMLKQILMKMEEVVTAYETFEEVINKYNELVEVASGRGNDSGATGGTLGTDGSIRNVTAAGESNPVETT